MLFAGRFLRRPAAQSGCTGGPIAQPPPSSRERARLVPLQQSRGRLPQPASPSWLLPCFVEYFTAFRQASAQRERTRSRLPQSG
jgi:hypothetical protein